MTSPNDPAKAWILKNWPRIESEAELERLSKSLWELSVICTSLNHKLIVNSKTVSLEDVT